VCGSVLMGPVSIGTFCEGDEFIRMILLLFHTPRAYGSARALRLCGPSTHCVHTENRALRPDKKLHAPVGVPPSGLLTSLCLLARYLPPATTRRTGGGKEGERRKEGGREKEMEREKREGRKWVYTGSTQPSRLSSSWWRHYRLLAICDLERHPISTQSSPFG
jgi:hypothetical protein